MGFIVKPHKDNKPSSSTTKRMVSREWTPALMADSNVGAQSILTINHNHFKHSFNFLCLFLKNRVLTRKRSIRVSKFEIHCPN